MNDWKKVKISNFLTERIGRYKPNDEAIAQYKRLDKIDFSGTIHLSDKPSKTDMILVHPGDLVISGINVAKGAVTVFQGDEPVTATIHYSSYTFDDSLVNLEYFKLFVKSPAFLDTLKQQVKGGIKTEIKAKTLLSLEIEIPTLEEQNQIVKTLSNKLQSVKNLTDEIASQKEYVKLLRQNILQDAIEGKLTDSWRKTHPVKKGNPDYDAEALFEKIQKEKDNHLRKKKEAFQIPIFEQSLSIPISWQCKKLGEISKQITDGTHQTPTYVKNGEIFLSAQNIKPFKFMPEIHKFVSKKDFDSYRTNRVPEVNDILIGRVGAGIGEAAVINQDICFAFYVSLALVKVFPQYINSDYLTIVINSKYGFEYAKGNISSSGTSAGNFNLGHIRSLKVPLPPLAEQTEIVAQVEKQLQTVTQLETQITNRETLTKQLMQSILKDAFEER